MPWHFGNKAGLLAAVVEQESNRFLAAFDEGPATVESAVTALVEFVRRPSTGLFVPLLEESVQPGSEIRRLHADLHRRVIEAVEQRIERSSPVPLAAEARRQRAALAVAAVIGIQQQWRISPGLIDVPGVCRLLLGALLEPNLNEPPRFECS